MRRGFSTAQLTTIYASLWSVAFHILYRRNKKKGKSSLDFLHLQCNTPLFSVNVVDNKQVPMLKLKCNYLDLK